MSRARWHIVGDGACLVLARHLPARFDVSATTVLPDANRLRLAHQIRQDMWRLLQALRGFSPVVSVTREAAHLHVQAGGRVDGPVDVARTNARISDLLSDPTLRRRWLVHGRAR